MPLSYEEQSRIRQEGVTFVLHLDIDNAQYVRAGEPGYVHVVAVSAELSAYFFQRLLTALAAGDAASIDDRAATAVSCLLVAGEARQAFLEPLLQGMSFGLDRALQDE